MTDDVPTSRRERALLADLFVEVGPAAPTLSGDWTTHDLAAHLVARERRPDGSVGIVVPALSGYAEKVRRSVRAGDYDDVVEKVREGPPRWSPTRRDAVDAAANTIEFFVHHEDVRRAREGWAARELDQGTRDDLASALRRFARFLARGLDVGLTLQPTDTTDRSPIRVSRGEPRVTVGGPIAELVLFMYGRKRVATVELAGPDDAVETVRLAEFGI